MKFCKLNNDLTIPFVGYGTYKIINSSNPKIIEDAIDVGYRLIDTASYYNNEEIIGQVIKNVAVPREELIITTKVWRANLGYDNVIKAVKESLHKLQLDYIDIVLLHWPANVNNYGDLWEEVNTSSWKALEKLYSDGIIKAIGLSNFTLPYLKPLLANVEVVPMINQLEFHPGYWQADTFNFCQENNILVQAWSPLARGKVFDTPIIQSLAKKYDKSPAQICLRWALDKNVVPIPKTVNKERMLENIDIFDFRLLPNEITAIDNLPVMGYSEHHPDNRDDSKNK